MVRVSLLSGVDWRRSKEPQLFGDVLVPPDNAETVYCHPLCASKEQFKNTGHMFLSFCITRANLKRFLGPAETPR